MKTTSVAIVMALVLATPTAAQGGDKTSVRKPTVVSGSVDVRGGTTVAGSSGAIWKLPGGPIVRAEPGTSVRVLHTPQPLTLGPGGTVAGYTVVLREGMLGVEVPPASKSAIVLVAPRQLSAIVKSGRTAAVAGPEGSAIANQAGELTTSLANGAYVPLAAGKLLDVSRSGKQTRDLPPAPGQMRGQRVLVATDSTAKLSALSWDPVEGAEGYRVSVAPTGEAAPLAETDVQAPSLASALAELRPGDYVVKVETRGPSGILSGRALEEPVRVLGCELPEGAWVDERGTLRLPRNQRAKFTGVDGLEMTYSSEGAFVRAFGSVGLYRNQPTTAFFRFPKSYELSVVRMAPRDLQARIEIGPSRATWPKDPVRIRIRAESTRGEAVPEWLELAPKVLVGIEPVDVSFTRNGPWLEATLPPRQGGGPWVVRVEVTDQFGYPLGRDFIEVIRTPKPKRAAPPASLAKLSQR